MYSVPHIAVINKSTVISNADLDAAIHAVQFQVQAHFHAVWNRNATMAGCITLPSGPNVWPCYIMDHSDVQGALGYHDDQSGVPILKIFAADTINDGMSWTVALSHEVLEALGDPLCNQCTQVGQQIFYAQEVCDACEDDSFGYTVQGVLCSDFVYPAWFTGDPGPYDKKGHITAAGQLLKGGYIGVYQCGKGWTQKIADESAPESHRIKMRAERWGQERVRRVR